MSFDVIAATCAALRKGLGVPSSSAVPAKRPKRFTTVERTGGGYSRGKDEPNLAVQVWAETETEAYTLALMAREVLINMRETCHSVCSCSVGGIYAFPDPDSGASRYQLDFYAVTRP